MTIQNDSKATRKSDPIIGVYSITCVPTGKTYIGLSKNVDARLSWHKSHLRTAKHPRLHLQEDFISHGEQNFTFVVLSKHATDDDARVEEAVRIAAAFKAGQIYNAVVPVDITEVFKQRTLNTAGRLAKEEVEQSRIREAEAAQAHVHLLRSLISEWLKTCLVGMNRWNNDRGFLQALEEFLEVAAISPEEFGRQAVGDTKFMQRLQTPEAPSVTLATVELVRKFIISYISGIAWDSEGLPILSTCQHLVNVQCERFQAWLYPERKAA
jgi:predicted GIY-YIG superfamily endonuclease